MAVNSSPPAPQLRDVRGPSALGGGLGRFWELTLMLATTEFKRTYFGTALGYLWSVGRPLLLFAVLVEVFTHVVRLGSQVPHYPVFLLFNMVLFGFFQEATTMAVPSIVGQEGIVRKTQFPRLAIPTAVVMTAFFNLLLNLIIVFAFILAFGITPSWTWFLLPVILAIMFLVTLAVSMIVSSLYPRFRDLGIIWSVFTTALFYATPILYPLEIAESRSHTLGTIIALNPFTPILELARVWVIDPQAPYPGTARGGGGGHLVLAVGVIVVVCVAAVWVFSREAPRIAEEL
ncbi:MAG TPA: ABC transporter permease [Solirubrobacteraceae bacterium]|nr:ABC transporter permease [Solirubrobacteraceae bacterium]